MATDSESALAQNDSAGHSDGDSPERSWRDRHSDSIAAYLFLAPFLLIYVIFLLFPVVQAALMSVYEWDLLDPRVRRFVGLDNYVEMFGSTGGLSWSATGNTGWRVLVLLILIAVLATAWRGAMGRATAAVTAAALVLTWVLLGFRPGADAAWTDGVFWSSFSNTMLFVLLSTPLIVGVALALAIPLARPGRMAGFLRIVFFAPYVLSVAVLTLIWGFLLNPDLGLIATVTGWFGMDPISWLTEPGFAMVAIVVTTLWWTMGFNLVLFIAGLQDIDPSLYEAATLDGANPWQRFVNITVPGLRRTLTLVTVLQVIASFQIFGQVYIMTRGGPGGTTRVLIQHIYESSFREFRLGYGAALSVFLFLVMLIASVIQFRLLNTEEDES